MMRGDGGRRAGRVAAVTTVCAVLLAGAGGCKKKPAAPTTEATAEASRDPKRVTVPPELAAQMRVGLPAETEVLGTLAVTARVAVVGRRMASVGAPVAGRITRLLVQEGQAVRQGQAMAMLHSTDLSDTQFAYVKAVSNEALAQQSTVRAEQLVAADVIGRAELDRRRAELLQARTEAASIRTQLRSLGMSEGAIAALGTNQRLNADYPVVSPIGGTVLERKVTLGQIVQPAEVDFQVADLSTVWVVANVPEEESGRLRQGMEVEVTLPALPGERIKGRLSYVAPTVDPGTRTVEVHMDLRNERGLYKPDMLASMTFLGKAERRLTVPETALVREDNKDWVFVVQGPTTYLLREVQLGPESPGAPDDERDDRRVVQQGLGAGERIVLEGAFHLNNQRKADAITGGD